MAQKIRTDQQEVVAFSAHATTATSLTSGSWTKVNFATELYQYGSSFASSTFTAPYDGIYNFQATVLVTTPTRTISALYVNGVSHKRGSDAHTSSTDGAGHISADVLLTAGDTVDVYTYQNSGSPKNVISSSATLTWFSGHLIART